MGMTRESTLLPAPSQEVQEALDQADDLLSEGLEKHAERNDVIQLRNIAVSGALLSIYQASLGNSNSRGPALAAQLLGTCHFFDSHVVYSDKTFRYGGIHHDS